MSNTELSEFFSLVSKEKNENLEQLKNKIKNPKSDLSNLFKQLEAHGLDRNKFLLTIKNLKFSNETIKFYTKMSLH